MPRLYDSEHDEVALGEALTTLAARVTKQIETRDKVLELIERFSIVAMNLRAALR